MTPPLPPPFPQSATTPPATDGFATAALVLGLLAVFCLGPLAGLPAIVCGITASSRMRNARSPLGGSGLALAGAVLGAFGSLVWIVGTIAFYRWSKVKLTGAKSLLGNFQRSLQLTLLKTAIETHHLAEGQWPGAEGTVDAEVDTAAVVEVLFRPRKDGAPATSLEAPNELVRNGRLVDEWGNLLHVAYDLDGDGKVSLGGRRIGDGPVAIWSNGPNGLNEWGAGDDVTSWRTGD